EIVRNGGQLREVVGAVTGRNALGEQQSVRVELGPELPHELHHLLSIRSGEAFEVKVHASEAMLVKIAVDVVNEIGTCLGVIQQGMQLVCTPTVSEVRDQRENGKSRATGEPDDGGIGRVVQISLSVLQGQPFGHKMCQRREVEAK